MLKYVTVLLLATALIAGSADFPRFQNRAEQAGLHFTLVSGAPEKPFIPESMSGGVGLIDYDNDGWLDIYLVNGSTLEAERKGGNRAVNRLYRNNRDGSFIDVTQKTGVGDTRWGMGVCAGDVDNDGWDDLYVSNFGPNKLYLNQGDGTFRDFSAESGTADPSWSSSAAFADADQDGDLDLYVSNYVEFDLDNPPTEGPHCTYRGLKVQCGPRGLPAQADRFYENIGGGRFADRTRESGLAVSTSYYGLGVIWGDIDNDGDPDLFVANDSTPNFLFQNDGRGRFVETALPAGVAFNEDGRAQAGMGVDLADYDNDGDLDLFVTNFSDDHNTLYRNEGDGFFTDVTYPAGLGDPSWQKLGWGAAFADLDLDGFQDLVFANGHVYPEVDRHQIGTAFKQSNQIFRNVGGKRFQEMTRQAGAGFSETFSSRGLAAGDVNNDGRVDLLISNLDAAPSLMLNRGAPGNWIMLKLRGVKSNRSAVGARVVLKTDDWSQMREVRSGGSYQSQGDFRLHFGLAEHSRAERIEIRWPSGVKQVLEDVKGGQILEIVEPSP